VYVRVCILHACWVRMRHPGSAVDKLVIVNMLVTNVNM